MKNVIYLVIVLLISGKSMAGNTYACTGKVLTIVTRASSEDTQIKIEGLTGMPRLGFGGDQYRHLHERQFATLLAAYMAGKSVTLEFLGSGISCSEDHQGVLIRYVAIN